MYSYVLFSTLPHEGLWILGVVNTLDEALEFFSKKITTKKLSITKKTDEELIFRALTDNWDDDYFSYWVEAWDKTQRMYTYKYNIKKNILEEYNQNSDSEQSE